MILKNHGVILINHGVILTNHDVILKNHVMIPSFLSNEQKTYRAMDTNITK